MPDDVIKKIIIKKKDLPNFIGNNNELAYSVKYRIVSDDKNKVSAWSPIYKLFGNTTADETGYDPLNSSTTGIPYAITVDPEKTTVEIKWTMPSLLILNPTEQEKTLQSLQSSIKDFDVYTQWQSLSVWTDWNWAGTSNGTQFSMTYPSEADSIRFRIQKVTQNKETFDAATYLITEEYSLAYFDSPQYISSLGSIMDYL